MQSKENVATLKMNVVVCNLLAYAKNANTRVNKSLHYDMLNFLEFLSSHRMIYLPHLFCRHEASFEVTQSRATQATAFLLIYSPKKYD